MKKSSFRCRLPLVILAVLLGDSVIGISKTDYLAQYKGTPYHDSRYQGGAQRIPGTILCAYYDLGGEEWLITTAMSRTTAAGRSTPPTEPICTSFA